MKVTRKTAAPMGVMFRTLTGGSCFEMIGPQDPTALFMKLQQECVGSREDSGVIYNAVSVESGSLFRFGEGVRVRPVKARAVVGD